MKSAEKNPDKELYKQLRRLTCEQLWEEEVPKFDRATPEERIKRVSLIRAVGVVFSESGTEAQKNAIKPWLHRLLQDPAEKVRRYAMAAMPKLGAGERDETELLALLRTTNVQREKKFLAQALDKIGGSATLESLGQSADEGLSRTQQKVKANVARTEQPSAVRMDSTLNEFTGLRIHFRGRSGLEQIAAEEIEGAKTGKFRVENVNSGLIAITPVAPFSLGDIFAFRCFGTAGFVLGEVDLRSGSDSMEAVAEVITSVLARRIFKTFTEGSLRYRLNFVAKGHQRGAVRLIAERAYALDPGILNDARDAPWAIDIHPLADGRSSVELRPRLTPDPRLFYRQNDVPASSHPPLAACMARLSRDGEAEIVWDPFCGSGLELIERCLLGGVRRVYGTDLSHEAIGITKANFAAAKLSAVEARFTRCDFREFAERGGLGPNSLSLIITNPPMGKRVPIPDLDQLIDDLFQVAATMLKPGGRLVFANPLPIEPRQRTLRRKSRRVVDFGGFDCRLEVYVKQAH
jgi:predicted RNA methylase